MANTGSFDLSSIFGIQQHYLLDMSNSYPAVNNSGTVATYVNNLQNQIQGLSASYANANTSGAAILDQQNQMIGIIDQEQQRLLEKQQLMDQSKAEQDRIALLNNSYRLRYVEYSKIMVVFVISLCIHIGLRLLGNYFEQIPNLPLTLAHVLNFTICGIIIIVIYATIWSRDQINFNQIDLPPPNTNGPAGYTASNTWFESSGSLFGATGPSVSGSSYCGPNTYFNPNANGGQGLCDVIPTPGTGPSPVVVSPSPVVNGPSPVVVSPSPVVVSPSPVVVSPSPIVVSPSTNGPSPTVNSPSSTLNSPSTSGPSAEGFVAPNVPYSHYTTHRYRKNYDTSPNPLLPQPQNKIISSIIQQLQPNYPFTQYEKF